MALALRLLSAVAVLSLAFGEVEHCCLISPLLSAHALANADIGFTWCTPRQADDDNTHAILQRLADASQSLMPVGDITVAEYNELRHGQETMSKEVAFICASGPRPAVSPLTWPCQPRPWFARPLAPLSSDQRSTCSSMPWRQPFARRRCK